jgi:hypothetical protein
MDFQPMFKLGHSQNGEWVEHCYSSVFRMPQSEQDRQRLVAGVPKGDPQIFGKLVEAMEPPFYLLYVLHTPRGEGEPGRYESPLVSGAEVQEFLTRFGQFLAGDARFDLWAHSPADNATVIWDRHNQIFAYGPLARFENTLRGLGFSTGDPVIPMPHEHHYRAGFDPQAKQLLETIEWRYSPLREDDKQ